MPKGGKGDYSFRNPSASEVGFTSIRKGSKKGMQGMDKKDVKKDGNVRVTRKAKSSNNKKY